MKRFLQSLPVLFILCNAFNSSAQHCNLALTYGANSCANCVTPHAGIAPYSFGWSSGHTTSCASGLAPGSYLVTVYDASGCWDTITVFTTGAPPLYVTITLSGNPSCPCYSFGLSGGAPLHSYSLNGMTLPIANPVCGLAPGQYTLLVGDIYGCYADTVFSISSSVFNLSSSTTPALCRNGTATVTTNGGTPPFSYLWNTIPPQTDSIATGLQAHYNYSVTVTDDSGCVQTTHVQIPTNSNLSSGINSVADTCGHGVGSLTGYALAGFPPYHYSWNTADTVPALYNRVSGNYILTVTDDSGCVYTSASTLQNFSPLHATTTIVQPSCTSYTGSITLNVTGGTGIYNYFWNTTPVQTTAVATGLPVGFYGCHVTDLQGCTLNVSAFVNDTSSFAVYAVATKDTCGNGTGTVTVSTINGQPPFTYKWNGLAPTSNPVLSNLHAGWNECIVTDQNLCVRKAKAFVHYFSTVHVSVTPHNASCVFTADGYADAIVTGATPPIQYSWTANSSVASTATNYLPGYYSCRVVDSLGCSDSRYFKIESDSILPCAVVIDGTVFNDVNVNCTQEAGDVGLSRILVGCLPQGGYHMTDNNGDYSFYLPPGNYRVWQPQLPPWHTVVCPSSDYLDTLPVAGMTATNNFANVGDAFDLQVSCFGCTAPVPGFTFIQSVYYRNQGTRTANNAVIKIKHDSLLTFLSCTPSASNYDAVNHIITVPLPVLNPFGSFNGSRGQIVINYQVPATVPIGTVLNFTDTIFPVVGDTVSLNNFENCYVTVVGPIDPNSLEVSPRGAGTQGFITTADSLISYLVRFQNTGNYPAQNVALKMPLDPDLDFSTFTADGSSFPYSLDIAADGIATFSFFNINLPDSTYDEPHSHGYFAFSLRQVPGLLPGTQIQGAADIYFDYNVPVATNATLNTIYDPASVHDPNLPGGDFSVYPNPVTWKMSLQADIKKSSLATVEISDALGKRVFLRQEYFSAGMQTINMDISFLNDGIYFVRLSTNDVNKVKKIVKIQTVK